ncbi:MAG TPA: NUDIX domain-containing protein [Thermohalobaculum sp.]|nr:NUDIX domain-containing protein [Thermohalobaculum sp.]
MRPLFLYGSLRDEELMAIVLGRAPEAPRPARAPGYAVRRLADEDYPVLVPADGEVAEGLLIDPPGPRELDRLSFYEGEEFEIGELEVESARGAERAAFFRPTVKAAATGARWDFRRWRERDRAVAIEAARELMEHHGAISPDEVEALWPGVDRRARQRTRARAMPRRTGLGRRVAGPGDVEVLELRRPFTGYLTVEEMTLSYRRFDGGRLGPVERTAVLWGDAVTVLPYDPAADRVLVIEQFRPGPAARGDPDPWCIEVVAGRIDAGETAEEVARREAREEAGLELGRVERIAAYYPSPGLAAEHITAFVAEARLSGAGGLYGVAHENEDIRSIALGFDEAMQAVRDGTVNAGPALVSLLWLGAERGRLRREWG